MAVPSTVSGDLQTAATCAVKTSSPPSSVSLHEDVFQSEKGEPKAVQAERCFIGLILDSFRRHAEITALVFPYKRRRSFSARA
ncbi:hypothetical protein M513_11911 [Trichuris suis]|uniref:Uncharacterized protein n=1 Tax=Trichuris suis TaxID=68888 RepID=A0A085LQF8_9BILA|nr:hypothetical protein M513_11911 [Trichuris suis]